MTITENDMVNDGTVERSAGAVAVVQAATILIDRRGHRPWSLWRLCEGRNKGCDGTDPDATDAGPRGRGSRPDPSGGAPTDEPDERRG